MPKTIKKKIIDFILKSGRKEYIDNLTKNTIYGYKDLNNLFKQFEIIQKNIECAHRESDFYIMYAIILSLQVNGPIVELGCYKGGSTAKLSLISKLTSRKLHIFDSFEGLPDPIGIDRKHNSNVDECFSKAEDEDLY